MKTQKEYTTKPLKNHEKYNDDLLEVLIAKRLKDCEVKKNKLSPSKSYKRLIKC